MKKASGPFTSAEEVDGYLERDETEAKRAQARMRDEIKYARDSSASLPRQHGLYKIMSTDPVTKKPHAKSAEEFANNPRILLGKAEN